MDYDYALKWCVEVLSIYAKDLGMTYEKLNIWIFGIIGPLIFIILVFLLMASYLKILSLQANIKSLEQ